MLLIVALLVLQFLQVLELFQNPNKVCSALSCPHHHEFAVAWVIITEFIELRTVEHECHDRFEPFLVSDRRFIFTLRLLP